MESILKNKSYDFAIRIIKLNQYLINDKKEFVLSKQVLRSGTGIGALVREAEFGQSRADFTSKMSIALKEANETDYWLSLLKDSKYLKDKEYNSLKSDIDELIKLLITSVKTSKKNQTK
ncbi:MAG: four helix bundle protein [Ignavibacteria bacterium GWB2_35_12]|nr:MAG: four helix bundle protein [Ignavibacteria bacterium GWA2_35_8]OGU39923.1 MAG: four helix bundle protein [Ignavibacteria bacterium GWB2_35_12]OGU91427.1 MAG: four helix bundle protein [Ignavibacteria bacterium RIFOXYA2_FULL_35_10]OGV22213.1 MAG: four helix bundle protein [Ignavibacteria bacterium RIFOXYC2_FULL_35_21]